MTVEFCFEMVYENSPHVEVIEVDDNTTPEELDEMAKQMVLDYAHIWYNKIEEEIEEN